MTYMFISIGALALINVIGVLSIIRILKRINDCCSHIEEDVIVNTELIVNNCCISESAAYGIFLALERIKKESIESEDYELIASIEKTKEYILSATDKFHKYPSEIETENKKEK